MKRHIMKDYDNVNDKWYITYVREYENSLYIQEFCTPVHTSGINSMRGCHKDCLVGLKRKLSETWLGKGFIDRIWTLFN